jgi:hypothetical protein
MNWISQKNERFTMFSMSTYLKKYGRMQHFGAWNGSNLELDFITKQI